MGASGRAAVSPMGRRSARAPACTAVSAQPIMAPDVLVGNDSRRGHLGAAGGRHDGEHRVLCKRRSNNPSLKRPGVPVAPE
jgi:hypothetical protein